MFFNIKLHNFEWFCGITITRETPKAGHIKNYIVPEVRSWFPTTDLSVSSRVISCEIRGTGASFSSSLLVLSRLIVIPPMLHTYLSSPLGCAIVLTRLPNTHSLRPLEGWDSRFESHSKFLVPVVYCLPPLAPVLLVISSVRQFCTKLQSTRLEWYLMANVNTKFSENQSAG